MALKLMGLKPTDVQLEPLGPTGIIAAMLAGQIPAGVIAPPDTYTAEAKGFKQLQDIYSQPYQNVGLVAKKSRLDELAPAFTPFLAAYRDGIAAIFSQPDLSMKLQGQYANVTDPDILKRNQDF